MDENIIFTRSAFKHGYTPKDIERAIETKICEGLLKAEDEIYVIVGFDTVANPIEIFYNSVNDETIKVFHVMALSEKIRSQLDL